RSKAHVEDVQNLESGFGEPGDFAIDGHEDRSGWWRGQLGRHFHGQRVASFINRRGHDFSLHTFPLPARRQVTASRLLFGQSWRQTPGPLAWILANVAIIDVALNDAAFILRDDNLHA